MRIVTITLLILICTSTQFFAQRLAWQGEDPNEVLLSSIGVGLYAGPVLHSGNSFVLPQAPTCCTGYGDEVGFGPTLSLVFQQELTKKITLQLRGTYSGLSGTFEADENLLLAGNINGVSRHTLSTTVHWLGAELLASYTLAEKLNIFVGAGAGTYLTPTFTQNEMLLSPGLGTFENNRRVRNEIPETEISNVTSPALFLLAGVGYNLVLSGNNALVLTPEVSFVKGLGNVTSDAEWSISALRVGARLQVALNPAKPALPVQFQRIDNIDTTVITIAPDANERTAVGMERVVIDTTVGSDVVVITEQVYRTDTVYTSLTPDLKATVAVRALSAEGKESDVFAINVSTQFVTEALPILPVVFFDAQAISLSFRYHQITSPSEFNSNTISPRTTAVHRDILNIIGERMQKKTNATITLKGTADPTTEGADCRLARQRAESVKHYLTQIWKIESERILIAESGNCAPTRVTRQATEQGYSENRRVEIETNDLEILEPVAKRKFNEPRTVNPPRLLFVSRATPEKYITDYTLTTVSGGEVLFSQRNTGVPGRSQQELTIETANKLMNGKSLEVALHVRGIKGSTVQATTRISVKNDTLAEELERLTLTLFEVSSDEVLPIAKEQIKQFVKNVPANATVIVRGFADKIGNAEFNRKLSQKRADAVCETIRGLMTKKINLQCDEIRSDTFPPGIDSDVTPEERFLSRTVQIEVRK